MKFVNKYSGGGAVVKKEPIKIKEDLSKREASIISEFHKKTAGGDRGLRDIPKKKEEIEEKTVVKKESFNTAFGNARKAGLKVFEWNGKKYGTKLASDTAKAKAEAPAKKESKAKPKMIRDTSDPIGRSYKPVEQYKPDRSAPLQKVEQVNKKESASTSKSPGLKISRDPKNLAGGKGQSFLIGKDRYYGKDKESIDDFKKRVDQVNRKKSAIASKQK